MVLPFSGPISAADINLQLGRLSGAAFSINDPEVRILAGVPTPNSPISLSDFYGKYKVHAGTHMFSEPGSYSWVCPGYNTLQVKMWGGGGAGGAPLEYSFVRNGGASTFNGMSAGGGSSAGAFIGVGAAGQQVGGASGSSAGNTGNLGIDNGDSTTTGGKGGNAPSGGGEGGLGGTAGLQITNHGSPGNAPGGGGGGLRQYEYYMDSGGPGFIEVYTGYSGGGSGAYVTRTYIQGDVGAPVPGYSYPAVVGVGGMLQNYTGVGASGRIIFEWS